MKAFKKIPVFVLPVFILLFSGCFETRFDFMTSVKPNGSVARVTKIEGRGSSLFKTPEGGGWKSKSWKTRGEKTLLPDIYYHVQAEGQFGPNQDIPSDYEFDVSRQSAEWSEKEKQRLAKAGIKMPFEENLFSRNRVKIHQVKGWLTVSTFYEEVFQNAGIIALLMMDLKEEIRRQAQDRGENFQDSELEDLARLRLEEEILPEIRFKSKVEMPGKLISTNGKENGKSGAVWEFSMRDFQAGYSVYTLRATSRVLRPVAIFFFGAIILLLLITFVLVLAGMSHFQNKPFDDRGRHKRKKI